MDLVEFVDASYGPEVAEKLKRIRTGGDNNQKGGLYEDFFAVARICAIAAHEEQLDQFEISSQELAFVDDLCIRDNSQRLKTNYQAKNSFGSAADWTDEIEERFRLQSRIDEEYFKSSRSCQILLVSCEATAQTNQRKIPACLRERCRSEFFPYKESSISLILEHRDLRQDLESVCLSRQLDAVDSAFKIVLGIWRADQHRRTIQEVFAQARKNSKPDLFLGLTRQEFAVPEWLVKKCAEFDGIDIQLRGGRYIVSRNGYGVSLPPNAVHHQDVLDKISTLEEFFRFLMSLSIPDLIN